VRAHKQGNDELGRLVDGFNEMLYQIQGRDADLKHARDQLEERVAERTRELREENAERKRAEIGLANSLSLLNATLESTTDGIVAVDLAGRAISCNSKFTAIWQFPPGLIARRDAAEMRAQTATQVRDAPAFLQLTQEQPALLAAKKSDLVEHKDGRTFERFVFPQLIEGRRVGTVISWRDITERRKVEDALRRQQTELRVLFDLVPALIVFKDLENIYLRVNERFAAAAHLSVEPPRSRRSTTSARSLIYSEPGVRARLARAVHGSDGTSWRVVILGCRDQQIPDPTHHSYAWHAPHALGCRASGSGPSRAENVVPPPLALVASGSSPELTARAR
jgi:PAS domain S-box-containing protein